MHILIIEDNHTIADNMRDFLMLDEHNVDICYDGTEGLKKAINRQYDCIVLDLMLPGTDGITICNQIREHKNTPIIMTTAKGTLDDK